MANSTIPNLVAVSVPALTDLFGVRQSGDSRDKKLSVTQLLTLIPSGGDVTKVGTPVNNQLGVWTGDGTIEGVPELTFTGVDFILGFNTGRIKGSNVNAGAILNEASSSANPTLVPDTADSDTGIGGSANNLSVIVRGTAATRWRHTTAIDNSINEFHKLVTGFTASTTQTQGNGLVNGNVYIEVTTVSNVDDVITLHNTGGAEYITTIINTGANRLQIFPPVGDLILPNALNASITLDVNKAVTLYTLDGTNWIRLVDPAGGSGDVIKVGTPVNNQLGIWTGDGTLEGDSDIQYDGNTFTMNLSGGDFRLTGKVELQGANRPAMQDESSSNTNPTLLPLGNSPLSGIGGQGSSVSMIAQSKGAVVATNLNSQILLAHQTNRTVTAFAGGGQGSAVILGSSYNVLSTVATTGDSVKLPILFLGADPCTVIYIKNDGANAADVFPGSGDDLGAGVDTAVSVAAGESVSFIATAGNATWTPFIVDTGGSGDVIKVGTPADNQLAVWTGDGTLEGDSSYGVIAGVFAATSSSGPAILNENSSATNPNLVPSKTDLDTGIGQNAADQLSLIAGGVEIARAQEAAVEQFIISPGAILGSAALPSLAFGDGDSGIRESVDDALKVTLAGVDRWTFTADRFVAVAGNGPSLQNEAATATNPTMIPALGDVSTGIGGVTTNLSLIVGGAERIHLDTSISIGNTFTGDWAAANATGPVILDEAVSGTNPTLAPQRGDEDTGIGRAGADILSLIAGGVEGIRVAEAAAVITNTLFGNLIGGAAGGPALFNESATFNNPNILPNKTDDDTGIGYGGADVLDLIAGASNRVRLTSGDSVFRGDWNANTSSGPALLDEGASSSNPTIVPNRADDDTGIGRDAVDSLALIVGGLDALRVREIGGARAVGFYTTTPIVQQTGVAVTDVAIHAALVALGLITA